MPVGVSASVATAPQLTLSRPRTLQLLRPEAGHQGDCPLARVGPQLPHPPHRIRGAARPGGACGWVFRLLGCWVVRLSLLCWAAYWLLMGLCWQLLGTCAPRAAQPRSACWRAAPLGAAWHALAAVWVGHHGLLQQPLLLIGSYSACPGSCSCRILPRAPCHSPCQHPDAMHTCLLSFLQASATSRPTPWTPTCCTSLTRGAEPQADLI